MESIRHSSLRGDAQRRPVVEIAPDVPIAVPGLALERDLQRVGVHGPLSARAVSPRAARERREGRQRRVEEPAEPDALAFALFADAVHAVVPVARADQRQPVPAEREALIERQRAMLEQRGAAFREIVGRKKLSASPAANGGAFEERNGFVEHERVAAWPRHIARRHRRARGGRRRCACARPGRNAAATNVARRPRRTAGPPRAADARASDRAAPRRAPCRPATDRESHRRRWPDRRPSAPRRGRRASDRAASR